MAKYYQYQSDIHDLEFDGKGFLVYPTPEKCYEALVINCHALGTLGDLTYFDTLNKIGVLSLLGEINIITVEK